MFAITNYLTPFALNFLATGIIYIGVLFMSGQLLPNALNTLYDNTNIISRTIIAVLVCSTPANVLISHIFKTNPASIASITNIISVVLMLTLIAIIIDNVKVNTTILISMAFAIIACANLLFQLQK